MTQQEINWPDDVRLKMIERSEHYGQPHLYQYGYYDGYQHAIEKLNGFNPEAVEKLYELVSDVLKWMKDNEDSLTIEYEWHTIRRFEEALTAAKLTP